MENKDQIEKIKILSEVVLKNFDWKKLKQELISSENPNLCWYYQNNQDGKIDVCQYGSDDGEIRFPNASIGAEYFTVEFTSTQNGNKKYFSEILSMALEIKGIDYIGINFLGPNMDFPEHVDMDVFTVLINIETNNECILQVGSEDYIFKNGDIFMFDGEIPHAVYNRSNSFWKQVVLRIKKNYTEE